MHALGAQLRSRTQRDSLAHRVGQPVALEQAAHAMLAQQHGNCVPGRAVRIRTAHQRRHLPTVRTCELRFDPCSAAWLAGAYQPYHLCICICFNCFNLDCDVVQAVNQMLMCSSIMQARVLHRQSNMA